MIVYKRKLTLGELVLAGVLVACSGGIISGCAQKRAKDVDDVSPSMETYSEWLTMGALKEIDDLVDRLESANIAFNTPSRLLLGEVAYIQLILSPEFKAEVLKEMVTAVGEVEAARIKVANDMEAILSGPGFKIEAMTKERRAIGASEPVEWKWRIEPTVVGKLDLHLAISAYLYVRNRTSPYVIRTFERTIEVRTTPVQRLTRFVVQNLQWLCTGVLVPTVGWLVVKEKRRGGKSHNTEGRGGAEDRGGGELDGRFEGYIRLHRSLDALQWYVPGAVIVGSGLVAVLVTALYGEGGGTEDASERLDVLGIILLFAGVVYCLAAYGMARLRKNRSRVEEVLAEMERGREPRGYFVIREGDKAVGAAKAFIIFLAGIGVICLILGLVMIW